MSNKQVLMITDEDPNFEPRVRNLAYLLREGFDWIYMTPHSCEGLRTITLNLNTRIQFHRHYPILLRKIISLLIRGVEALKALFPILDFLLSKYQLKNRNPAHATPVIDVVIFTHPRLLPLAELYAKKAQAVVCDLYEYYPDLYPDPIQSPQQKQVARWQLRDLHRPWMHCLCASPYTAERYSEEFGIKATYLPCSVPFQELSFVMPDKSRPTAAVYLGTANPSRKVERIIQMFGGREDLTLDLFLVFPSHLPAYERKIKALCDSHPNITLRAPLEKFALIRVMNRFDVGLFILPANSINHDIAVPNKVFDFIQARIPCIITPNKGLSKIVLENGTGLVVEDESLEAFDRAVNLFRKMGKAAFKDALEKAAKTTALENYQKVVKQVILGTASDE